MSQMNLNVRWKEVTKMNGQRYNVPTLNDLYICAACLSNDDGEPATSRTLFQNNHAGNNHFPICKKCRPRFCTCLVCSERREKKNNKRNQNEDTLSETLFSASKYGKKKMKKMFKKKNITITDNNKKYIIIVTRSSVTSKSKCNI